MRWLVFVVLVGCGPRVDPPEGGSEDGSETGDGTTGTPTPTPSTSTSTSTSTTTSTVTAASPTSSTDDSTGDAESSSTGPAPVCIEPDHRYARAEFDFDGPDSFDADCDVVDIGGGLDGTSVFLDCGADGMQMIGTFEFDVEALLEPYPTVHVRAERDLTPPAWWHVAVYDLDGVLIFGSYDLSPFALDVIDWFAPLEYAIVEGLCEPTQGDHCVEERIAIDFTSGDETVRIYDLNRDDLAGQTINTRASILQPGAGRECPDEPTRDGWFTVLRIP